MIRLSIILFFCSLTSCSKKNPKCFNIKIDHQTLYLKNEVHIIFGDKSHRDSIYIYDKQCVLSKKIFFNTLSDLNFKEYLKNNYDIEFINSNNNLYVDNQEKEVKETYTIGGKKVLNRFWKFDSNLEIDTLNSIFFDYKILDTIKKSESYIGEFDFYFNKDKYKKNIKEYQYIIVGRNINKSFNNISEVEVDTFVANENKFIYKFEKEGSNSLNIKIINKLVYSEKGHENDSLFIVEEDRYHYLSKGILVE